jgi:hypothetical protein
MKLMLWLHREEADAWLVSLSGVGSGVFLPKSQIAIEAGHPVPVMQPVGPVAIELPAWLAQRERLVVEREEGQGSLFDRQPGSRL